MSPRDAGGPGHRIAHLARRRHPATVAKVITTGVATSGFLGTIGLLAAHSQTPPSAAAAPIASDPATSTEIVTDTVHRTVYVDEFGKPVEPPNPAPEAATGSAGSAGSLLHSTATQSTAAMVVPSTTDMTVATDAQPVGEPPVTNSAAQSPPTTARRPMATSPAAPPADSEVPAATTADAAASNAPAATSPPATAPPVTEPPTTAAPVTAPATTAPPPPPTTAAPAPPATAPSPPPCQGTQCP